MREFDGLKLFHIYIYIFIYAFECQSVGYYVDSSMTSSTLASLTSFSIPLFFLYK